MNNLNRVIINGNLTTDCKLERAKNGTAYGGFCIAVNRSVKKMEEDGFISRKGHKIMISRAQYEMMKEYLDDILDQTNE